ncbi:MAG: DUF4184 family protein [Actinomycetota bacterium]
MPVTIPAHQGLIVPVKLRWPNAVDGTALCIGAASPDLAYTLGQWLNRQSHTLTGLVVWALPFTLVAAALVRWRGASGAFAVLPDLGPLRLRSYRVLGRRRPRWWVTLLGAVVGAGSHIMIDGFTHAGRWGANLAGLNGMVGSVPIRGEMTAARVLQYLGHGVGSLAFAVALVIIGSSGRLEVWYGRDEVARARAVVATGLERLVFAVLALGPTIAAIITAQVLDRSVIFLPLTAGVLALLLASVVTGSLIDRRLTAKDGPDGRSTRLAGWRQIPTPTRVTVPGNG